MLEERILGLTGLSVTPLCVGTSPLASMPRQYGYEVPEERAIATMRRVFQGPITFVDTSNNYGYGDGENRIGAALREIGGLPKGFVLATKVDPAQGSQDFSGRRVRQSVEESLERLGVSRLQLVYLHDPEKITFEEAMEPGGAVEALLEMRDEGLVDHVGVAGGPINLLQRFLGTGAFEVVITHNRYTLVDRSAEILLRDARDAGVAVVNGAPFGGGILVKGPEAHPLYAYRPPSDAVIQAVHAMQRACEPHGVPLAAAALQFSMREARIASTIVGMSEPARVDQTIELAEWPIPESLWGELDSLQPQTALELD
ncbi:MAG: oxidoreductase, aldo/keto reductase family [Acidimicrobiaceae bacterium]|jgi:D-threo-aldose 1-dehydrogenase|nr:oxidoreductase, aldo/keto reductase family [Acidimicrobiaceae bacterium]